jgi:hypothetical protein
MIPAFEREKTFYASDRAATVIGREEEVVVHFKVLSQESLGMSREDKQKLLVEPEFTLRLGPI